MLIYIKDFYCSNFGKKQKRVKRKSPVIFHQDITSPLYFNTSLYFNKSSGSKMYTNPSPSLASEDGAHVSPP